MERLLVHRLEMLVQVKVLLVEDVVFESLAVLLAGRRQDRGHLVRAKHLHGAPLGERAEHDGVPECGRRGFNVVRGVIVDEQLLAISGGRLRGFHGQLNQWYRG